MKPGHVAVVGAGFSGAAVARELAQAGWRVSVFESRDHVAGNCHTARDPATGVMVHVYGPHIFHTDRPHVWDYVKQFDEFMPFVNRVKAIYQGRVYSLPINLMTINGFFGRCFSPEQARAFLASLSVRGTGEPQTFEEQALRFVGRELYEAFFKGYTEKQWGRSPTQLPASILRRLPVRFNYDDNYYNSPYQGMPRHGYTQLMERILDHPQIRVALSTPLNRHDAVGYDHVFYTGPIDAWFGHALGRLAYRTLDFVTERHVGDHQGNAVINHCDPEVPWTRVSEHKHFSPWESHEQTLIYKEYSRECGVLDTPYYPVRLLDDKTLLHQYVTWAQQEKRVTFLGRLATYRYLDMHITIDEALQTAHLFLDCARRGAPMPAFALDPLN
ncbi:MAG: hypothetical protein RL657_815 [Pseudomonadota bacterium]